MNNTTKINLLLQQLPPGVVLLSSWLNKQGYSYALQQRYRESSWFKAIGKGAMVRTGDQLVLNGAIYSLQTQANMQIHIGGRTALGMQGLAHYLELYSRETLVFAPRGIKLPGWLIENTWDSVPVLIKTSFLPAEIGLTDYKEGAFSLRISGPARAMMECLELAPASFDLTEARDLMEGLTSLQPGTVQELLEECDSIKVKRLFLYFAEKAGHDWFRHLETGKINLGHGKRSIVPNGTLVPGYQITLPKHLV